MFLSFKHRAVCLNHPRKGKVSALFCDIFANVCKCLLTITSLVGTSYHFLDEFECQLQTKPEANIGVGTQICFFNQVHILESNIK